MKQGHKKPRNQEQSVIVVAKQSLEVKRFATIQKLGRHHVALVCPRRDRVVQRVDVSTVAIRNLQMQKLLYPVDVERQEIYARASPLVKMCQIEGKPSAHALQGKDLAPSNAAAKHAETIMDRGIQPLKSRKV